MPARARRTRPIFDRERVDKRCGFSYNGCAAAKGGGREGKVARMRRAIALAVMLAALAALLAGCSAIVVEDGARVQVGEREYSQKIS